VNAWYDIFTVHKNGLGARRPQRDMQDRTVFGDVDLLAREHRVDPPAQTGLLRQLQEQRHGLAGDTILRVIEVEPRRLGGKAQAPLAVIREQVPQMQRACLLAMIFERLPRGPLGEPSFRDRFCYCCHV
jgi:hypothetical protein